MSKQVFKSGTFAGVDVRDAFARSATNQEPVVVKLGPIRWPAGMAPAAAALGSYTPGEKITTALSVKADVLIVLYTDPETSALLDVFTQNNDWSPATKKKWCGYAHNFTKFKPIIQGVAGDSALEQGMFGYLSAVQIAGKTVVLYKSELHPKQNGNHLPFVPVIQQLISELAPGLVISTGTAGGIGSELKCGDVAITSEARLHLKNSYPAVQGIDTISANHTELGSSVSINTEYLSCAAGNLTKLSLPGLSQCYSRLQKLPGYSFVSKNTLAPAIYVTGKNPVPGPQPMVIVSADYLTVDDKNDSEGLQSLGVMNDTDDGFVFYAISKLPGQKPNCVSVRNASEPQIVAQPFPPGTPQDQIVDKLKGIAGSIYGIYQYCTTLNSAFACWGLVAGM